ncbi:MULTISPECIES: ABC transporter substrate-binding protein [unclassified Ensifer]|uniref:ABC transporter substrate-binding protein n=1 Tax=unclassified Ensifer TaxID=2633371 RepID=UPI000812EF02|nr:MULTISPECIES: ABC transporter substrate-binding protein [unclassified Ensifer]OCO99272.1 ABC transporter substrate-binding protein [Ensifer sp. LC11]OCO99474.1 ABC transporter substrate-binding protein [Ensifer sp. LC13]OCP14440.1 ABC transporter substrate-binding protein [Ensifer sp. LC14]OCP29687.1 ABC transporter substrate-binding protein [Ensifer sp. LC499]
MSQIFSTTGGLSRRTLLKATTAAGAAAALGVAASRATNYAIAGNLSKITLEWTEVAACHSPVGFGLHKGIYAKHGLDVELFYQGASGQTLIQALATRKAEAGPGLLYDWLKPIEQGFDVKLFAGSHGGCQRLLVKPDAGIQSLADLKGKTIGTFDVGSPSRVAFSVALAKAGLDPERDVTWKVFPFDLVAEGVLKGEADAVAHMDPWAYSYEKQHGFLKIYDTQTGVFKDRVCCVLGVNGDYLQANKDAIRRVATANLEIHQYTAEHPDEVAKWYFDTLKPGIPLDDLTEVLASFTYHKHWFGKELIKEVQIGYEDLKLAGVVEAATDPAEIANRITVDILA